MTAEEETAACEAMRGGCREARDRLIMAAVPWALSMSRRTAIRPSLREDMECHVLMMLVSRIGLFDASRGRLTTYVGYITRHESWQFARLAAKRDAVSLSDRDPPARPVDETTYLDDETVRHALCRLSEAERSVIDARYERGLTYREIGDERGTSAQRARQIEYRALARLRRHLRCESLSRQPD